MNSFEITPKKLKIIYKSLFRSNLKIYGNKNIILKKFSEFPKQNRNAIKEYSNECIYVGHCEIIDFETGLKAKTRPKIGKSRYLTALNRGRSQGGCDWIFDYIYFVSAHLRRNSNLLI